MREKDIVRNTIKFNKPKEIPVLMWIDLIRYEMKSRLLREKAYRVIKDRFDKHIIQLMPDGEEIPLCSMEWPKTNEGWRDLMRDWIFGSVWPCGGFVFKKGRLAWAPLENNFTVKAIEKIEFPNPTDPFYLSRAKKRIKDNRDKYLLGFVWYTLFEKMHFLSGFENVFVGPILYKNEFFKLQSKIMDYNLKLIKHWGKLGIDGIFMSDDWGSQTSLLISPQQWREIYKPCYKELFKEIHKGGMDAWLHTCGYSLPIIEDLIDIGLDVINPIQPQANNIEELAEKFGGKICFCGGIDIQKTTVTGSPKDVEREIKNLFDKFGKKFGGGFIPAPCNTILEDTSPENIKAIYDAVDKINVKLPW